MEFICGAVVVQFNMHGSCQGRGFSLAIFLCKSLNAPIGATAYRL